MQRLSGLDASFLYLETPSTPMHTMGMLLLEERQPRLTLRAIESLLLDRMHHLPALRKRVVNVPFQIDHPVLVDDPDFDIRKHVVRVHWDEPRTHSDVDWAAGVLAGQTLDRHRPLWRAWWFDNLEDGGSALVFKLHHAIIDGVSAALFMAQLLDTQPVLPPRRSLIHPTPSHEVPRRATLALRAIADQARKSASATQGALGLTRDLRKRMPDGVASEQGRPEPRPRTFFLPPRASFNGSLSGKRTISRASASLEDFRYIKKAFDLTINDVVLAACTLALGRYLQDNGGVPRRPLIASVPVSTRGVDDEPGGNHISILLVRLPVHLLRAEDVIDSIRLDTLSAKRVHKKLPAGFVESALEFVPPAAMTWLARQHDRFRLADLHPPPSNLVISNIPGPPMSLFCAGARVRAAYPFGPLMNGMGINITVMSYMERMDIGLIACPRRMPHAQGLVSSISSAVETLCDAADRAGCRHNQPAPSFTPLRVPTPQRRRIASISPHHVTRRA